MNPISMNAMAASLLAIAFLFQSGVQAQTKTGPRTKSSAKTGPEISDRDWGRLAGALSREEWDNSIRLSSQYLSQLSGENDKKQMAQLRYLNLFALAGRLSALIAGRNLPAIEPAREDVETASRQFKGRELIAPPRTFSISCAGKLNFICAVKDNPKALRVTATNKNGDAILSFDYVLFGEEVKPYEMDGKRVFLGGLLDRVDVNPDIDKPWMMRLSLKNGSARIGIGQ